MLELIIGTTDQGYLEEGSSWRNGTWPGGFKLKYRAHPPGDADADVVYSFFGLAPGTYNLYIHWESQPKDHPWRSNVPYQVFDDSDQVGSFSVDQTKTLVDFWESFGEFTINSGVMRVVASSVPDNWIVADGVRITKP